MDERMVRTRDGRRAWIAAQMGAGTLAMARECGMVWDATAREYVRVVLAGGGGPRPTYVEQRS